MAFKYKLHRRAYVELDEAINWYIKHGGSKLAARFFKNYQKLRDRILENPLQYAEIELGCRQAVFKNFPFVIIYFPTEDEVFILAVFHTSRNPKNWMERV